MVLGIIILVIAIVLFFAKEGIKNVTEGGLDLTKKSWIIWSVVGFGLFLITNPIIYNSAGERTYAQDPIFGSEKVVFNPGLNWGGLFCRTQKWPDVMSTEFDSTNTVSIRFNDATQGEAWANVRWDLPKDEVAMINLHKSYLRPENLQLRTLEPYTRECLAFAAQLMESEVHYSGGQSKLKEDFRDQLLNGQYVLSTNTSFMYDSIRNERVKITNTDLRRDANGQPLRIPSDVQMYQVKAVFAAVPKVDYESIVDEKLQAKIEQSTKESIAKQTLITAQQEALTAKARATQLLEETRASEEAEKLKAVIQAEKAKAVAQQEALQAKFYADKVEQEGRAKAIANQALRAAGLTPQEQAEWDYKKHVDGIRALAEGIGKTQWPAVMTFGGGQGNPTNPIEALGIKSLLDISNSIGKNPSPTASKK